ncbi:MAG: YeiH family protein [Limnochordia bacterium]|jgi:uncharacterized integral membrane protein (TIGR00698 family)|nr:putative sulfate exporter family transporter [Bacillota bacterium]HBG09364.1 putative sulfate exporter family transporter [Bacillota bacterium]HOA36307.1 putative sulfate exporter family transporter [Bacillota bacterium]
MLSLFKKEDWWANWLGGFFILIAAAGLLRTVPKLPKWDHWQDALSVELLLPLVLWGLGLALVTALALRIMGENAGKYLTAFPAVFGLAVLAFIIGNQKTLNQYGFNDVIWALVLGLLISNLWRKPSWLVPAIRTELFIKTGLVLLGAEILFTRVLTLGTHGLGVAWTVPPLLMILMYLYGTKVLKIDSKALVATVATCTSVCGVSAAIATGAAVKAKKEEISAAISVSLIVTVIMMLGMPVLIRWIGLSDAIAGAWIGGTVDATGAVVMAGSMVSPEAMEVAAIVKMLQNALIGITAFCWAVFFVTRVENEPGVERLSVKEIWRRFPKFILGFVAASLITSFVLVPAFGEAEVDGILKVTAAVRNWLFAMAFVTIGLDSRFVDLRRAFKGYATVNLHLVGQAANVILTLIAALLCFKGL